MRTLKDTPTSDETTPGFTPGTGVDNQPKPYFREGTPVHYDVAPGVNGTGRIRGLASQHVVDIWLVERDLIQDPSQYPWSTIAVPHTCLKRLP